MGNTLNILFICNKSPWPPHEGGPIAMNNLIEGVLGAGHNVKVLAINTSKYNVDPKDIPDYYKKQTDIELIDIDLSIKTFPAFLNLFTGKSYHVERFISDNFRNKLRKVLSKQNFDIVQIETLFMSPYINTIREYSSASIVLRAHNIEHLIWKRVASITRNPIKKAYLKHLATTLENYEMGVLNKYDGIIPISEKDADFFISKSNKPVQTISFGIVPDKLTDSIAVKTEHALFHIGSMNWIPNQEGISWFLEYVWPYINKEFPDLKLYLAGREMPDKLKKLNQDNVEVVGEVSNAYEFIKSKAILIAPLFSGSGIRIKIIESMALSKAVISTTIGAEGISYTNGKNIMIADDAESFIKAIKELVNDKNKCNMIGNNARALILQEHDNAKLVEWLIGFYCKIIDDKL
ncbi:MAG: glycosyltransferase [Bacteroidetes bacterium]|nr:glycosyltransferase [Bacteroidota bacterium]MBL6943431.1 glycosyltransferase [Bacteroidales bacterium]